MNLQRRRGSKIEHVQSYWERQLQINRAVAFGTLGLAIMVSIALPASSRSIFLSSDDARKLAITEMIRGFPAKAHSIMAVTSWEMQDLTPTGILGASKVQYLSKSWTITISYAVVWHPVYTVEIQYNGVPSFLWRGTVDQAGKVVEI